MKKVLVIGSHSYIGLKFEEYVASNDNIDFMLKLVSASEGSWRKEDFSIYDAVIHLSGIVHKKEKRNMESLYYQINHELTVEIAKKAKNEHVKQFIFMSTAAVFGRYNECITKETVPYPTTYYGKSKLAAEQDVIKLQDNEFNVVIVRPPMVYGDGCKGNYPRLVKLAKHTPVFPAYHNKRSMIHIDKLTEYLTQIIINNKRGYFHPQDNEYADTCTLVIRIRREMGKKTILISTLNFLIKPLCNKFLSINKLFGNCYYSGIE